MVGGRKCGIGGEVTRGNRVSAMSIQKKRPRRKLKKKSNVWGVLTVKFSPQIGKLSFVSVDSTVLRETI